MTDITERVLRQNVADLRARLEAAKDVLEDICTEAEANPDHPSLTYSIAKQGLRSW
jgi:hypothetical protein